MKKKTSFYSQKNVLLQPTHKFKTSYTPVKTGSNYYMNACKPIYQVFSVLRIIKKKIYQKKGYSGDMDQWPF